MTIATPTRRTRILRAILDTATNAATITAGATTALITYRTTARRSPEARIILALGAGALATTLADQYGYTLLTPLRRRLGIQLPTTATVPVPSLASIREDVLTDAAERAAMRIWHLDRSHGPLNHAQHWQGAPDGTATLRLSPNAVIRYQPSHKELNTTASAGWTERYDLIAYDHQVELVSMAQLRELVERLADGRPLLDDDEDDREDPWTVLQPADREHPLLDEDDDQADHATVHAIPAWQTGHGEEPPF